jgi:hypothetical protein
MRQQSLASLGFDRPHKQKRLCLARSRHTKPARAAGIRPQ